MFFHALRFATCPSRFPHVFTTHATSKLKVGVALPPTCTRFTAAPIHIFLCLFVRSSTHCSFTAQARNTSANVKQQAYPIQLETYSKLVFVHALLAYCPSAYCLLYLIVKVLHEILASSHYQSWRQVGRARMAWQYVLCSPPLVGWNKNARRKRKLNMA